MAEKKEQQTQEHQGFICPGDCIMCEASQRIYCAAQNSYYAMRVIQGMKSAIDELRDKVNALEERQRKKGTAQKVEPQENQ